MKEWVFYEQEFEYEKDFADHIWPWSGHKFFVYDLLRNLNPSRFVELGTHKGTCFFSCLQAVKDGKLKTEVNAVDCWEGDEHAGFYDEEVYNGVKTIKNKFYKGINGNMIKKTFDDALADFKEKSIDVLHIDGLHTYKAVKHDLDTWLPKVKEDGVILLHDIVVKRGDFGVYKLWDELKKKYTTAEFHHSNGLGVIILGNNPLKDILNKKQEEAMRKNYSERAEVKATFFTASKKDEVIEELQEAIKEKNKWIDHLQKDIDFLNLELKRAKEKFPKKVARAIKTRVVK